MCLSLDPTQSVGNTSKHLDFSTYDILQKHTRGLFYGNDIFLIQPHNSAPLKQSIYIFNS